MSAIKRKVLRSIHISHIWDREIRKLAFHGKTSWQEIAVGAIERFLKLPQGEEIVSIVKKDQMLGYGLTIKTLYIPWNVDGKLQEYAKKYPNASLSEVIRGILKKILNLPGKD